MTKDEIIALARDAGVISSSPFIGMREREFLALKKYTELATAKERASRKAAQIENELLKDVLAGAAMKERRAVWAEREACASVCDGLVPSNEWYDFQRATGQTARECGKAIRARVRNDLRPQGRI